MLHEMIYIIFLLNLVLVQNIGNAKKYFSNFIFEDIVFGQDHLIKDYVTLANDPNGNLPDSYSVCTSVFVKFCTSNKGIIQMLKQDGTPWYSVEIFTTDRQYERKSEKILIWFENPTTGKLSSEAFSKANIPIVPHSWYHICIGLDTVSGLLRIVVNGVEVVNEEKEYFRNSVHWKPKSLDGKVVQLKGFFSGFWYQYRSIFSNLNIFSSMMSVEAMVTRTTGGEGCDSPGDYLRYFLELIILEAKDV